MNKLNYIIKGLKLSHLQTSAIPCLAVHGEFIKVNCENHTINRDGGVVGETDTQVTL